MRRLPKQTPPRVRAAILRTWLNGWCTGARFGQRRGTCRLGCPSARDDLRHYVCCPVLWRFGVDELRVQDPATPEGRTAKALLWDTASSKEELVREARLIATGYRAHCKLRHTPSAELVHIDIQRLLKELSRSC